MKDLLVEFQRIQALRRRMTIFELAMANFCDEFGRPQPQPERIGPRPCCAEFAPRVSCDGDTDTFTCAICGREWSAPCPNPTV